MFSHARPFAIFAAVTALFAACAKVPYTDRKQYNLVPDVLMRSLGKSTYASMLSEVKTRDKGADNDVLQKVGRKISRAADQPNYDWEFTLIREDEVNAWCLPGGYIGFYTGILPALRNEAGMAFVMGHEVGHATAHHGAERLTQQLTLVGGLLGLELWLQDHSKLDRKQRMIVLGALGVGGTVGVLLPFSRMHEAEADVIGMMYMSKAGYPPGESIEVWDRMGRESKGGMKLPTFLSTHPSHQQRQGNLKDWMPQARKRYQRNALAYDTLQTLWGRGGDAAPRDDDRTPRDGDGPRDGKKGDGKKGDKKNGGGRDDGTVSGRRLDPTTPVFAE